ncbi:MAG: hypothetical protein J5858_15745 [Lentisphaeria bacterium]|nr:hypothetical protein [Lentisphaeria bacterium]
MKFSSIQEFAVLVFSSASIKGCWFKKRSGRFVLKNYVSAAVNPENPAESWKKLRKELGFGSDCIIFLAGNIGNDGIFYRTAAPVLPPKSLHDALMFGLPGQLPGEVTDEEIQFTPAGKLPDGTEIAVNVYAFTPSGLDRVTAQISQSLKKVDYLLYPLLALHLDDPPLYLPEIEPDFFFADGQWHDRSRWDDSMYAPWEKHFRECFDFPEGFSVKDYSDCLLIARFACSPDFSAQQAGIRILPRKFRPGRLRNQLKIMGILLGLLAFGLIWEHGGALIRASQEQGRLEAERANLEHQVRKLRNQLKSGEKEQKEFARVLNQKPGENELIGRLADLSRILPDNVMVQMLRWSDSSVDLTLRSEAENLNLPQLLKPLTYWKIAQLQERRRNNEVTRNITLKLVPAGGEK